MIHLNPICCGCEEAVGTVQHGYDWYCLECADFMLDRPEPDEFYTGGDAYDRHRDDVERMMEDQAYAT